MSLPVGKDYTNSVNSGAGFKWRTAVDIFGRPTYNTNTYNGTNTQVSRNFYDPLGNLLLVGLGTTGSTTNPYIDYLSIKKNIREQVVNQMSKNYRVGLTYDGAGNVTNQYWSNEKFEPATTSSTKINQYAYTYDKMNRLIGADYMQSTMTSNPFAYYASLNGTIPVDFNCLLDGGVVSLAFNPYYAKFEDNIKNGIDVSRSQSSINALKQLESDYIGNNVQYADMSSTQINDFLTAYLNNCNRNRLSPLEFEYYQAISANDQAHIISLNGATRNPTPAILKYMKILLSSIPWTPPMSCTPNPNATAYGYLQNFPTPTAAANSTKYDAAYWYQKNGNFNTLNRNDDAGVKTQQLYSYQANTNRLTQASFQLGSGTPAPYTYAYDANGNLTTDPKNAVSNIAYSFFDELPVSITNTSEQHNYRYFGGKRSVKEISDADREYFIDQVILDQNGAVKSYQTAAGYAIPNVNGTTADYFYQVKDWLGSPHITLNSAGAIQNAWDYYPYGKKMPARNWFSTGYEGYRYQFTGHEKDGETNYQYHGARYYDEDLARYMSVDPWADKYANWSTYNYAMSNPTKFIDPTGKGVEYTEPEALAMAERGKQNGYDTKVVKNPNKKGDYGVKYTRSTGGKTYKGTQFEGKFNGIKNNPFMKDKKIVDDKFIKAAAAVKSGVNEVEGNIAGVETGPIGISLDASYEVKKAKSNISYVYNMDKEKIGAKVSSGIFEMAVDNEGAYQVSVKMGDSFSAGVNSAGEWFTSGSSTSGKLTVSATSYVKAGDFVDKVGNGLGRMADAFLDALFPPSYPSNYTTPPPLIPLPIPVVP